MAENATKCSAAEGVTQTFDFRHGMPLMVRAVDFNALHAECQKLRKDAERYRWLRDLLAVEDVARLVDEHAQWSWCETDPMHIEAESAKTDTAVDKAMAASRAVGAA